MPTYVYRREDGTTFEAVQRMSDAPLTHDPETGQPVERVISGAGLIFKGSGFYLTDYVRKGDGEKKGGAEEKPAAKTEPKTEPKASESKAAAAAD